MSLAGISSGTVPSQSTSQTPLQQLQALLKQLQQNINSNNVDAAQQNLNSLQQLIQKVPALQNALSGTTGSSDAGQAQSPLQQTLNALDQDLQSGNAGSAKQDFATLAQDIKNALHLHRHGGGHHRNGVAPNAAATTTDTDGDGDNSGSATGGINIIT